MTIPENVFVKSAKYVSDYRITFHFTDGHATEIDFHAFLTASGQNMMATQFLDVTRFKTFTLSSVLTLYGAIGRCVSPLPRCMQEIWALDSLGRKRVSRTRPVGRRSTARPVGVARKTKGTAVK